MLRDRVNSANQLYAIICDLVRLCMSLDNLWSVENPGRSFMWSTTPFKILVSQISHKSSILVCRRKQTMLIHKTNHFEELNLVCNNDHEHEPWGMTPNGQWAAAEEVAYPWNLCQNCFRAAYQRHHLPHTLFCNARTFPSGPKSHHSHPTS